MNYDAGYDLWPMFDSYIKKVIKSINSDFTRRQKLLWQELQTENNVILSILSKKSNPHAEQYSIEQQSITIDGKRYIFYNDMLFSAIQQLPPHQLRVIILKYWARYSE